MNYIFCKEPKGKGFGGASHRASLDQTGRILWNPTQERDCGYMRSIQADDA